MKPSIIRYAIERNYKGYPEWVNVILLEGSANSVEWTDNFQKAHKFLSKRNAQKIIDAAYLADSSEFKVEITEHEITGGTLN